MFNYPHPIQTEVGIFLRTRKSAIRTYFQYYGIVLAEILEDARV